MSEFSMARKKKSDPVAIILLLIFGVMGGLISGLVLYGFPVSILTCEYVETAQVDCLVQERMAGLISVQEAAISGLKDANVTSQILTRREDGREVRETVYQVTLTGNSNQVTLASFDQFAGVFAERTVDKINDFLLTYTDEPLRIWQASWVPLLVGGFFFLFSALMVYVAVTATIRDVIKKLRCS